jgi:hypothetical protein
MADNSNAAAAQHRMNTPQLSSTAGHDDVTTAAAVAPVAAGCTAVAAANGSTAAHSATYVFDLRSWALAAFVSLQHRTRALVDSTQQARVCRSLLLLLLLIGQTSFEENQRDHRRRNITTDLTTGSCCWARMGGAIRVGVSLPAREQVACAHHVSTVSVISVMLTYVSGLCRAKNSRIRWLQLMEQCLS